MSSRWWLMCVVVLLSNSAWAKIDFQSLIQGQLVLLTEPRVDEFKQRAIVNSAGLTVQASPAQVGALDVKDELRWYFSAGGSYMDSAGNYWVKDPLFEGALPDETNRGFSESPVWKYQYNPHNLILGSITLIPNAEIPDGKWIITAELNYGVLNFNHVRQFQHGPAKHVRTRVNVLLTCSLPQPGPIVLSRDASVEYGHGDPKWQADALTVAYVGELTKCKSAGGDLYLQFTIAEFQRFQFNGIQISMTKAQ